jgi:acetoacetate decarboxylase
MTTVRYAARPVGQREDKEVKATKIGAWSTSVTAMFLTDPDVLASVLPPPLQPGVEPLVKVGISRVDLGRGLPPFGAGTFGVAACHDGHEGFYPLLMPMTTEQSVIGGRETFGEPKKLAQIELQHTGDALTATVARMGVTIVEVSGTVGDALEPPPAEERLDFYFKFLRDPAGEGFDDDPWLVYCHRETETRTHHAVDGTLVLRDSRFDPVADFPVLGPVEITLSERRSQQRGELKLRVPAADLLPFAHQRYDDLSPVGKDD